MRKKIDLKAVIQTAVKPEVEGHLTFNELATAWLATTQNGDDLYRLRKWTDVFGDRTAWSVTTDEIAAAADGMLAHGYAPGSVNRDVGAIGSMFKWVVHERRAPAGFSSPTLSIRRFVEPVRVVEVTPAAIKNLQDISTTGNKAFGLFVRFLIDTGCRKGEIYPRKWSEVDIDRRRIILTSGDTKTRKARVLFFSEETAAFIKRFFPKRDANALLFPGRCPTLPVNFRTSWQTLTAQAAQILGHSVQILERRYGHLTVDDMQSAVEAAWARRAAA